MIQCRNKFLQGWCVLWFWSLLSDGIVWLSCLAVKASYFDILLSSEVELTWSRCFSLPESCSTQPLWGTFQHDQTCPGLAWQPKNYARRNRERMRRMFLVSQWVLHCWIYKVSLYRLTWGRADFSCWYGPSWAIRNAMTGGPPCPHQWLAMIPVPAQPPLLLTLHRAGSFASSATGCGRVGLGAAATLHFLTEDWDCKNLSSFLGQ